jgi:hypothetical protein
MVSAGDPVVLTWTAFTESGTAQAIVGYNVYRLDAETYLPPASTIDDYVMRGTLVGSTVGQPDINRFVDTAPAVVTPPLDEYTYAIQPLLRCEGAGCTPLAATFGGSEGPPLDPGKANLSTDSLISDGGPPFAGTVRVSPPLYAAFADFQVERRGSSVVVRWMTALEIDTLAFDVYRGASAEEAAMERVARVSPKGPGVWYEVEERLVPAGPLFYQVREVSANLPSRTEVREAKLAGSGGRGGRSRVRGRIALGGDGDDATQELRRRAR